VVTPVVFRALMGTRLYGVTAETSGCARLGQGADERRLDVLDPKRMGASAHVKTHGSNRIQGPLSAIMHSAQLCTVG